MILAERIVVEEIRVGIGGLYNSNITFSRKGISQRETSL
jgi:hypothetical protein